MFRLNNDILHLIFEYLEDNKNDLYSCLLVNKTWCEIIVLILWKDPWNELTNFPHFSSTILLLNVIISHIQDEAKIKEVYNYFINSGIHLSSCQRPLLNYIRFCKHLNLGTIMNITEYIKDLSERLIVEDEIFKLFINKDVKITYLYIPKKFNCQLHLIPEAKICFSKIKFLKCYTNIGNNILTGLSECKSIENLALFIESSNNNYEIIKLIKAQKKLVNVYFGSHDDYHEPQDEPFCKILENSLIKHSDTIQYFARFKPFTTGILSSLTNLKSLELHADQLFEESKWKCLENLSLPSLQFLILQDFPVKYLISLIENTKGSLTIIELHNYGNFYSENENERIIHSIYQNCPKLIYLTFTPQVSNIIEIEKLLTICQYLIGLRIISNYGFNWDNFFSALTKISPINLYKLCFENNFSMEIAHIKFFIDNWKGRNPIFLKLQCKTMEIKYLLEEYELEGRIVEYDEW
ncbi:hypothetical protein RhiirA1_468053 [Rhizophagus irregularis]|uniref:F-box domain-containing protein n=1 Tax=Rhizophagus irregularis TaxID=588596 RepID=A0A2I1F2Z3_9GLOM|nr:hypothetical protein RhiirA1_468053 [Rhizophagus irregularis]PKY28736.1 hypothetical protein RhiirB3_445068 [Rhizophagus irregularis]